MSPGDTDIVISIRSPDRPSAIPYRAARTIPVTRGPHSDDQGLPLAGQPGHGCTASLRRQATRIVEGRVEGGYTVGVFEFICCECGDHPYGDHPYMDYSEYGLLRDLAPASADPRALHDEGGPCSV